MLAGLNAIYLGQRRSLLHSVLRIVRDRQTAEDLTQESYIRLRKASETGPIEHVEAFLHETARNLALDHIRRNKTRSRFERRDETETALANVAADLPSLEEQVIQRERLRKLTAALDGLPERARQVWVLSRVEGWSYPRIAEHLGVSPNTVFNDVKLAMGHCLDALARLDRD